MGGGLEIASNRSGRSPTEPRRFSSLGVPAGGVPVLKTAFKIARAGIRPSPGSVFMNGYSEARSETGPSS